MKLKGFRDGHVPVHATNLVLKLLYIAHILAFAHDSKDDVVYDSFEIIY